MHEDGPSAQNSSASISTAQHFIWKCQLLIRKIAIAWIQLMSLFEMYLMWAKISHVVLDFDEKKKKNKVKKDNNEYFIEYFRPNIT